MAHGHSGPRFQSPLSRPDLPTQADLQLQISHRYDWITYSPCQKVYSHLVFAEPPEVVFVKLSPPSETPRPIPIHPHIYSNGFICLDLLSSAGWSPVQTVESVCMSLQSMLTANTKNERPPDDAEFVKGNKRRPRDVNFYYHDDNV